MRSSMEGYFERSWECLILGYHDCPLSWVHVLPSISIQWNRTFYWCNSLHCIVRKQKLLQVYFKFLISCLCSFWISYALLLVDLMIERNHWPLQREENIQPSSCIRTEEFQSELRTSEPYGQRQLSECKQIQIFKERISVKKKENLKHIIDTNYNNICAYDTDIQSTGPYS